MSATDPANEPTADDATLGGYLRVHDRPPAYEGRDGHPYTVSLEVEKTANLRAPYAGYLVFPRWAQTGVGIVGHLETPTLVEGRSAEEVEAALGTKTLLEVQGLLEEAIARRREPEDDGGAPPTATDDAPATDDTPTTADAPATAEDAR